MTRAQSMEVLRRLRKRSVVQGTADEGRFGLQGDAEGVFDTGDDRVREFDDVGGPRLSPVRQRQGVLVRQRRSPGPEAESLGESRVFDQPGRRGLRLPLDLRAAERIGQDRKSTRLNSSHVAISYAVFCL